MTLNKPTENLGQLNSSDTYDIYFKSFVAVRNISMLLFSKPSFIAYTTVIFIVVIIASILRLITELREGQSTSESENDASKTWFFIDNEIILDDEKALQELHRATDKCYSKRYFLKCIELLIYCPHLINVSLPTSNGITPFHRVCYRGHFNLIDFMINKGANLSQETESGENAFHMVIDYYVRNSSQKNFNCLDLLYENGCFLKKDSKWYKRFVSDAKKTENKDLVQWLRSHITPVNK